MPLNSHKLISITFTAAFAASGFAYAASTSIDDTGHGAHAVHESTAPSGNPAIRAYQDANDRMHAGMAIQFTGDADVDFMRGMIPHHQGAVDMARVVLEHGSDPEIRKLAEQIIAAQEKEIQLIRKWLTDQGH